MKVLGLTGSIGMGKSTAARMLRRMGLPLHDSDAVVHRLLGPGGAAVPAVAAAFPDAVREGAVDRRLLGALVFHDAAALTRLEAILHPLVRQACREFLKRERRRGSALAVLDIPLLFETGAESLCDAVMVVTAPAFLQRLRVLRRPGMTPARFEAIRAKQMPEAEKLRRADFRLHTGLGKGWTFRRLKAIVTLLLRSPTGAKQGRLHQRSLTSVAGNRPRHGNDRP